MYKFQVATEYEDTLLYDQLVAAPAIRFKHDATIACFGGGYSMKLKDQGTIIGVLVLLQDTAKFLADGTGQLHHRWSVSQAGSWHSGACSIGFIKDLIKPPRATPLAVVIGDVSRDILEEITGQWFRASADGLVELLKARPDAKLVIAGIGAPALPELPVPVVRVGGA